MGVRSLGYLYLDVTDSEAWSAFGRDFLGMMPVEGRDPAARYFRIDEHAHRLAIREADEPKMTAMGLEVTDGRELSELADAVAAYGIEVTAGTKDDCRERRVAGLVRFDDPGGNPVELYYRPTLDATPVQTPLVSRFVTGDMGLGHVILSAEDADSQYDFYTRVLGFVERNTMARGKVVFMGCNPRHHTFGIAAQPGPGRLLHLMLEAATLDDVGRALDRAAEYDIPMMHTLGRHTNDHMVSFYVYSPEGYAIEFGCDGLRVEQERPTYEIAQGAFWGHRFSPPPSTREAEQGHHR